MQHLPLFAQLHQQPVLVVGGGTIAARKVHILLKAQAKVHVVAHTLNPELTELHQQQRIIWLAKNFHEQQLQRVLFVIAATDCHHTNQAVFNAAQAQYKLVNVVDNPKLCNVIFPAIIDRSPLQIAISSGGHAPVLARLWREKLEALLPSYLGNMTAQAGKWREKVKQKLPLLSQRRRFWERLFNHQTFHQLHENQQPEIANQMIEQLLQQESETLYTGSVSLVGAGTGDAGLLTLKGLQKIQAADVVLYDALVSEQILDLVRKDAEKIFVGKRAKGEKVAQETTNHLMIQLAKQGKRVVRLKGGDPFVFGRGGEELQALKAAHIPFDIVPGITAALGATAYAGIPLTHRDHAQTAVFITGHLQDNSHELDWQTLARPKQTLAVYMGTIKANTLTEKLIHYGRNPNTPVAVISHGSLPSQQVFSGSLKELPQLAQQAPTPALIIIGETAALHTQLAWFGTPSTQPTPSKTHAPVN